MKNNRYIFWVLVVLSMVLAIYNFYNIISNDKPKYESYIDWDAWEKAYENCNKPVLDYLGNTPMSCNQKNSNECELMKLKYDTLYWKSIYCEDNIKILDYEKVREIKDDN